MRLVRPLTAAVGALAIVLLLAACGGGDEGHEHGEGNAKVAPGARVIEVDASSFEFDPDTITIDAGEDVAIELKSSDAFHDFEVRGSEHAGHVVGANSGDTAKGGLMIDKPGRYEFFCSVSGHENAGMKGTLVVR